MRKKESPAGKQGPSVEQNKGSNNFHTSKSIAATDTQRMAYAATAALRATELTRARQFFLERPGGAYSRADLCELLNLPINHTTRVVRDLLDGGYIEIFGKQLNSRSGRTVQVLRLTGRGGVSNE